MKIAIEYFAKIKNERLLSFVFWFASIVAIDQLGKFFAFKYIQQPLLIFLNEIPIFGLSLFENHNFAFSIPISDALMYFLYTIILLILFIYFFKNFTELKRNEFFGYVLILAGSISNVAERIIFGYVKDFIYLWNGAIINFADLAIIFGIVYLLFIQYKNFRIS